jgi:hypothetical protein
MIFWLAAVWKALEKEGIIDWFAEIWKDLVTVWDNISHILIGGGLYLHLFTNGNTISIGSANVAKREDE